MKDSRAPGGAKSSAGGARAASGLRFQAEVFAWWAAHAVSDTPPGFGLDSQVRVDAVGCETGFPVDDVGVALSDGGFILVQAKGGMRRLDLRAQDLRAAVDQLVRAMIDGLYAGVPMRPVDVSRDRLVLATNQDSSKSFDTLAEVCGRLRDLPQAMPIAAAAVTEDEKWAFRSLLGTIRSSWAAAADREIADDELRDLLRVLEVIRFDFQADTGADRVRCETMLQHASVPKPFSVLIRLGIEIAQGRAWRQKSALLAEVGAGSSTMALAEYTRAWKASGPVVVGEIPQQPPGFQPRPDLLAKLKPSWPGNPVVHAITGMAGAGKTQLASAYARARVAERWHLVAWVNAETQASLQAGLGAVVDALELSGTASSQASGGDPGHLIRHWLEADGNRSLLVLDNAADPDVLRPFMPASGTAQVLITSNRQSTAHLGAPVAITAFTSEEAVAYLMGQTGLTDTADAAAVAAELGFLPLALAQAAGVIAAQHLTYRTYLDRLRSLPAREHLIREQGQPYPHSAVDAVLLSLEALRDGGAGEACIATLEFMAVLSTSGVRRDLLHAAGEAGTLAGDGATTLTVSMVDRMLGLLGERSLLTFSVDGETVTSHRLVLRVVRDVLASQGRLPGLCRAAALVLRAREAARAGSQDRPALRDIADQIIALRDSAAAAPSFGHDGELAGMLTGLQLRALYILNRLGDSAQQAIAIGEPLVKDLGKLAGPDHPETLNARSDLAEAYRAAGRLAEATALHEQVLAAKEQLLGTDHPSTVNSRNNLAAIYQHAGRTDDAVSILEQAIPVCDTMFGPDDPRTLTTRNNLALAYEDAGRTGEGFQLHEQTLADRERVLGPHHPDTMNSRNNLAEAHRAAGRIDEAIRLHKQNLTDRKRVLGSDHPITLTSQNNLAGTYLEAGRTAEAIALFKQTLAELERVLGPDHPDTLRSRINLALRYQQTGRAAETIPLYEQALLTIEQALGPDNPTTTAFRDQLAAARKDKDADATG